MKKLGIIGCGNMGGAIARSLVKLGVLEGSELIVSDRHEEKLAALSAETGAEVTSSNVTAAEQSEMIMLAVKPQYLGELLDEIKDHVRPEQTVISIAAGKSLAFLESYLGSEAKIVRTMPTTAALVGASASAVAPNANVTDEETAEVLKLFRGFGTADIIPEASFDAFTAVSSSPAFVFMMIEALTDGAVASGLPRASAQRMVEQTVYGSAKLALETGKHPGELKDMVCSPAGTTIEGVNVLEDAGFRAALIDAFRAAAEKSASM